ncbi:ankyrin repeat domain-containing protein [Flavobacterium sp. H122]|uniref:ankyrin repeat domain-containing protein n=1 Tax=Flavobacterium sp. H122 TaxID=2529860 RepID=UPI0010A9B981|nr:ankyrin repeat domain-containing protein [Flavobacterium sp. H122]
MSDIFKVLLIVLCMPMTGFSQSDVFAIARTGNVNEMIELVKKNPDIVNAVNEEGNTPLIIASYKNNYEVVEFIVQKVKNIDCTSGMGTALMAASVKNNIQIVKLLLKNGANPNFSDKNGTTALHYAVNFKLYDIASLLIQYKANVDLADIRKKTAFDYAVIANDDQMIQILKTK